ncbi:hypothetical protein Ahy_B01g051591 [Arachis hypogaea]|uniref:RNase H type-1 domain-containing protein n=1 Tax=Arachis hypogaea TaxID=3818 RepID=A0A445AME6_ARAHY|nr:hypothetical protein Ahy_B01g051591 [Arachis hypogaea]
METRASQEKMNRIRRRLNFDKIFCVELRGLSGGLCLLWKSNTNIDVYKWCANYIKASININNVLKWQGVFVYGNPVFQKRRKLWQELTVSNRCWEEPQAYLGYFNDILSQDEKVGIHPQPRIYLYTFRRFVDDNDLMDIDLKGSKYTWCSNLRNNFITRERLDRVLVNWKWLHIHQNVILKAALAISSTHCALILETQPRDQIKREFRFEAFWTEHEECEEVIRRSWQQDDGNINCWNQFIRKRSRCKRKLMEWSRRKFKRADKEIEKKKSELQQIQECDMTDGDQRREKELKNQISDLWKQEEKYWGQRSRLKWLKWSDKNTAFFHAITIQRRMRNRIEKLKDEARHWIQGEVDIMRLVEIHFTKLFTSEGDRNLEECTREIPMRIKCKDGRRITWKPLPHNRTKVNTDASFHRETSMAASAAVVRDWQEKIIIGTTSTFKTTSALAAEAQAYREALILIKNLQIRNCIIETDCLPLVQAIKARTPLAKADAIIRDILLLLEEAPDVGATWTPREGNNLAHQLAAMTAGNQLQRQWSIIPPVQVRNTIITEAGFSILQHNQYNRNQDNQVSVSTSFQGGQNEERLPGRVETETCHRHAAKGEERSQPMIPQWPINRISNSTFNIVRRVNTGEADRLTTLEEVAQQRSSSGCVMALRPGISRRNQGLRRRGNTAVPGQKYGNFGRVSSLRMIDLVIGSMHQVPELLTDVAMTKAER